MHFKVGIVFLKKTISSGKCTMTGQKCQLYEGTKCRALDMI